MTDAPSPAAVAVPDAPDPALRFRPRVHPLRDLGELWRHRGMVRALAERDLRSRYKQAIFGVAWAVVTPLLLMVVSTLVFQKVAKQDTGPAPYALFSYLGSLPWTFFNTSLSTGGSSIISNNSLLNKVYCPREVFPISSMAVAGADMVLATAMLGVLFGVYGYGPTATAVWVPVLLVIQIAFTMGLCLLISGVFVYVRDLRQLLPMLLQVGLFATPVFYGVEKFPEGARQIYATVNPLVGVIDGYRRTILYGQAPDWDLVLPGAATAVVVLCLGYVSMKRLEVGFADVA